MFPWQCETAAELWRFSPRWHTLFKTLLHTTGQVLRRRCCGLQGNGLLTACITPYPFALPVLPEAGLLLRDLAPSGQLLVCKKKRPASALAQLDAVRLLPICMYTALQTRSEVEARWALRTQRLQDRVHQLELQLQQTHQQAASRPSSAGGANQQRPTRMPMTQN